MPIAWWRISMKHLTALTQASNGFLCQNWSGLNVMSDWFQGRVSQNEILWVFSMAMNGTGFHRRIASYLQRHYYLQWMRNSPGSSSFMTKTPTGRSFRRRWRTSSSSSAGLLRKLRWTPSQSIVIVIITITFATIILFIIGPESDHWLCLSLTNWLTDCRLVNFIDVTLVCEDGSSKLVEVVTVCVDDENNADEAQGLVKILSLFSILLLMFCRGYEIESWSRFWS